MPGALCTSSIAHLFFVGCVVVFAILQSFNYIFKTAIKFLFNMVVLKFSSLKMQDWLVWLLIHNADERQRCINDDKTIFIWAACSKKAASETKLKMRLQIGNRHLFRFTISPYNSMKTRDNQLRLLKTQKDENEIKK